MTIKKIELSDQDLIDLSGALEAYVAAFEEMDADPYPGKTAEEKARDE